HHGDAPIAVQPVPGGSTVLHDAAIEGAVSGLSGGRASRRVTATAAAIACVALVGGAVATWRLKSSGPPAPVPAAARAMRVLAARGPALVPPPVAPPSALVVTPTPPPPTSTTPSVVPSPSTPTAAERPAAPPSAIVRPAPRGSARPGPGRGSR